MVRPHKGGTPARVLCLSPGHIVPPAVPARFAGGPGRLTEEASARALFRGADTDRDATFTNSGQGSLAVRSGTQHGHAYRVLGTLKGRTDALEPTLVTLTEQGRTTTRALADEHRELARQLFAGLPDDTFDQFDAGLNHLVDRLRTLLAGPAPGPS